MKCGGLLKLSALLALLVGYAQAPGLQAFVAQGTAYLRSGDFYGLRAFLLGYGALAPLVSVALMTVQSVVPFVPGMLMTFANAWLFGWQLGSVYSAVGALLGAAVDFCLARWYGKPLLDRLMPAQTAQATGRLIERHGVLAVLVTRLVPIVPFKIVSYGAGFSSMALRPFLLVTAVGQMPGILLYSALGARMAERPSLFFATTFFLLLLGAVAVLLRRRIWRWLLGDW